MKKSGLILLMAAMALCLPLRAQMTANYYPSDDVIVNPERGFYVQYESLNGSILLTKESLVNLRESKGMTLILMMYYLPEFIDSPISDKALANIQTNFDTMRSAGVKCVLRFAYRWSESTRPWDPTVEMTQQHIAQLAPVLRRNSDVIAVMQAGFVGVWGEWYYSTNFGFPNADFPKRNTVVDALLAALPERRMVQVRTPNLKMGIVGITATDPVTDNTAYNGSKNSRLGHHNDCFLANSSDYGTYGNLTKEKAYLEKDSKFLVVGGETCNPSDFGLCSNALLEMERFHWTYLNSGYHRTVLNGFTTGGCMDIIKRRLGYRLTMERASFTASAKPGGWVSFDIKLVNTGWAAPFNPRDVEIILTGAGGNDKYWIRLPDDPRFWFTNQRISIRHEVKLPDNIPEGAYQVYLNLPDPEAELFDRPEYSIRTANVGTWDAVTGYNDLKIRFTVSASATDSGGSSDLQFIPFPRTPRFGVLTGIDEASVAPATKLYPNPVAADGRLTAEFDADRTEDVRVSITSLTGQQMQWSTVPVVPGYNHLVLPLAGTLSPGIYVLSVQGSSRYLVKKLSVQD
jgi:hypothetical protein